ncbi:MAG: hypothetical protein DRP56_04840 [Planctomycetota bacterium]|nr:MAG: hypothetical protein DRP56_04840 [Planctomycetota bacterium]
MKRAIQITQDANGKPEVYTHKEIYTQVDEIRVIEQKIDTLTTLMKAKKETLQEMTLKVEIDNIQGFVFDAF